MTPEEDFFRQPANANPMKDQDCITFLQWALPRLGLRWPGFRKVRRRVCKHLDRRLAELGLDTVTEYRLFLDAHAAEWQQLDGFCRITISRFYRDKGVFDALRDKLLPELAALAERQGGPLRCWSAGCAGGEEPYTLSILWALEVAPRFPGVGLEVLATDADPQALARAEKGCYEWSSLKELPPRWLEQALRRENGRYCVQDVFRHPVWFLRQDLRREMPEGPFHLILCRNLAFTYFDPPVQRAVAQRLVEQLHEGGALAVGVHEALPEGVQGLRPWGEGRGIYRKG